jgi:hypothetical protein
LNCGVRAGELNVMSVEREDFDFDAWLAKSRPPFRVCVRSGADSLALGRGKLRDRLIVALFCLGSSDGRDVPEGLRPRYEAIREQVRQRAGIENELDLARLRTWLVRCKIATAERLARDIMTMDRRLTAREG